MTQRVFSTNTTVPKLSKSQCFNCANALFGCPNAFEKRFCVQRHKRVQELLAENSKLREQIRTLRNALRAKGEKQ